MSAKHEIDPTTQISMLAPSPASLAVKRTVALEEGGYYRQPPEAPVLGGSLEAEIAALDRLDEAAETQARISNMRRGHYRLEHTEGADPDEVVRLGETIETSDNRRLWLGREAKQAFARSLGIETEVREETRLVKASPQLVKVVRAKDPDRQQELDQQYRDFKAKYGASNKTRQRQLRRQELEAEAHAAAA